MKTNGFRIFFLRVILLVFLCLYFVLVFGQPEAGVKNVRTEQAPGGLPKLLNFGATATVGQVMLSWEFETMTGLSDCVLEKSDRSGNFGAVAYFFITEDIHINRLSFKDKVKKRGQCWYRLKLTDPDGHIEYSSPIEVNCK
jgi:hypothetical protein